MKKINLTLLAVLCSAVFTCVFAQAPTISSFSPASRPAGSSVTINGSNFSATAANNAVYFGAVKATVTSATTAKLVVTAPKSAEFAPITVVNTVTKLQTVSSKRFKPTFGPIDFRLSAQYDPAIRLPYLTSLSTLISVDVDNDGKIDLVAFRSGGQTNPGNVFVYPNTTPAGSKTVVYGNPVMILPDLLSYGTNVEVFDMNTDGKLDLVVESNNGIIILLNNSTPGNITQTAFSAALTVSTWGKLTVGDVDGDGKPDILTGHNYYPDFYEFDHSEVHIFRNTTTNGTISFAPYTTLLPASEIHNIELADMDGDNKADLVLGENTISVWRNKAVAGVADATSFEQGIRINTGGEPFYQVEVVDLNDDGKPDILGFVDQLYDEWNDYTYPSSLIVVRNLAATGSITVSSFDSPVNLATGITRFATGDVNGDSKPDLFFTENRKVSIRKNQTTTGAFNSGSFGATIILPSNDDGMLSATDLNGDGMADIITIGWTGEALSTNIYVGSPEIVAPTITSVSPLRGPAGTMVTITGTNFTSGPGTATVYFGAVNAEVLTTSQTQLTVKVPAGATHQPISVVNNAKSRVAYWQTPFSITYPIVTPGLAANKTLGVPKNPNGLAVVDIDGNGKPEMITANADANGISIFKNISPPGNISASERIDLATGSKPTSVTIGDINADGKPDVIVTNYNSNTISIFCNIAVKGTVSAASFANRVDIAVGTQPNAAAISDLNGDGLADIIVTNYGNNTISVLRNISPVTGVINSDTFAPAMSITGLNTPTGISVADLDNDGKPDMAVTSFSTNKVMVLRNATTGETLAFSAPVSFSTGTGPFALVVSDVNGDGKADIAIANKTANTLSILRNQSGVGTIAFAAKVDLATGTQPQAIAVGDMNGDGKPELLTANYTSNSVTAFGNGVSGGNITTGAFLKYTVPAGTNPQGIAVADIDLDGKSDLVVANGGSSNVYIYRNDPIPQKAIISSISPVTASVGETVVIKGDNFSYDKNTNIVYFGATRGTVTQATPTELKVTLPAGATYAPVSVLHIGSKTTAYSAVNFIPSFIQKSKEFYDNDLIMALDKSLPIRPRHIKIADVDGDGKPDLVVTPDAGEDVLIYRNTSATGTINASSFTEQVQFWTGALPAGVHVKDLNSDGKPDLIVTNRIGGYISILQNKSTVGSVSFAEKVDFGTGLKPSPAITADINGDGKPEIIVANTNENTISIYPNLITSGNITTASFGPRVNYAVGTNPVGLSAGELDGDGKPDIVVANTGSSSISVLKNTSSGDITAASFLKLNVNLNNGNVTDVVIGDIDGDGVNDITTINNAISVLRNAGLNGTGAPVNFAAADRPTSLTIADIDGDGKPEALVTSSGAKGPLLSVLRNASVSGIINTSSFDEHIDFSTNTSSASVVAGDLDNDGKADVVLGNSSSGRLYIFKNNPLYVTPSITSFSPLKGPAGTIVTITGNNFHKKASKNVVYFGGVKANATSGSTTSLSVVVPKGTTYEFLSVLNSGNGRVAQSANKFLQTYSPSKPTIENSDFEPKVNVPAESFLGNSYLVDFDNDGKLDIVSNGSGNYAVYVQRNIAVSGSLTASSFAPYKKVSETLWGPLSFADLDGDNKTDIVCMMRWSLSIIKNTSTPGNISFAPVVIIPLSSVGEAGRASIADIDGDGRPDIIANMYNNGFVNYRIALFKNISDKGSITVNSFMPPAYIHSTNRLWGSQLADIDGDGKADIVSSLKIGSTNTAKISVYRNIATAGIVNASSFAAQQTIDIADVLYNGQVQLVDIDGDGKLDVIDENASALRNQSTPGNISLLPPVTLGLAPIFGSQRMTFSDINGDGKPDWLVNSLVVRNTSTVGSFKFDVDNVVQPSNSNDIVGAGDLDGDGKPDLLWYHPAIQRNNTQPALLAAAAIAGPENDLAITAAVSPNGDGVNDVFTINGIEKYPTNKLTIVNSNGNKVYETAGYNNNSRAFSGLSSAGERQQAGTYFYNLEYKEDGVTKSKAGYLVLKY